MRKMMIAMLVLLVAALAAAGEGFPEPNGFIEARLGLRTGEDPLQRDESLAETRLQLAFNHLGRSIESMLRLDAVYDDLGADDLDLEAGRGPLDLRDAWLQFSPARAVDVKIGRQILTWGSGDLLFINDLFPKDWQSFFAGRDEEYLKAPSDALMVSLFPKFGSVDLVYVPRFDADRYIRGERFSFYNPGRGRLTGREEISDPLQPDEWFRDDELHLRVSGNAGGREWAVYGYRGFWKSPAGQDTGSQRPSFPELQVWGASLRGSLGKGLFNLEVGYYDSRSDRDGGDPAVANSEWRLLAGYERELQRELTLGLQYYLEALQDYPTYRASLPAEVPARDEYRHLLTLRLTKQAYKQKLTLSLFSYWSPSDRDGYSRPAIRYKLTDDWLLTAGGNLFWGARNHTFFGQFEDAGNLYAGARYSF